MELAIVPSLRRRLRAEVEPDPLRDRLAEVVEETTLAILDPAVIEAMAEDMRIVQRKRVHHIGLVVDSLVLSAREGTKETGGRWLDAYGI